MTEIKNTEQELARFRIRLAAAVFVLFAFGLLGARLAWLQIVRHEELSTQAENNRIAVVPIVPNRGLILDRNGVVLANNYSAYTLEIAPAKVGSVDATIDELAEIVDIQPRDRKRLSACSKKAGASSRCRSARASTTKRWRVSRRRSSASTASRSRRACFATIRSARSAAI